VCEFTIHSHSREPENFSSPLQLDSECVWVWNAFLMPARETERERERASAMKSFIWGSLSLSLSPLPAILPFAPSSNSTAVDSQKWNQLNVWSAVSHFLSRIRHHFPSRFFTPVFIYVCACVWVKKRTNQPLALF